MKLPDHLSASSINTFIQCPFKSYARYAKINQIPVDTKAADFGRSIHLAIPMYYDSIPQLPPIADIIDTVEIIFSENGNYATTSMKTKFERVKKNFVAFENKRVVNGIKKPTIMEKRFTVQLYDDLPPVQIIPDAYFSDIRMVADWKTGSSFSMDGDTILQGIAYQDGLIKEGHPVDKVVFVDLEKGCEPPLPKVASGFLYSRAKQMCDQIQLDRFPARPSYLCKWCGYQIACAFRNNCPWGNL